MASLYSYSDGPLDFVPEDAHYRTPSDCLDLGVSFVQCDTFLSEDEEANGTEGPDSDDDSVHCSQYRQFSSKTQHADVSQTQLEDLGEFWFSEDGLTRAGEHNVNSGHVETAQQAQGTAA